MVRQGDIIKFGRVPIMIKEWSYDQQRWQYQQQLLKAQEEDANLKRHGAMGGDVLRDN